MVALEVFEGPASGHQEVVQTLVGVVPDRIQKLLHGLVLEHHSPVFHVQDEDHQMHGFHAIGEDAFSRALRLAKRAQMAVGAGELGWGLETGHRLAFL
jgi:hypothetical protein